MLLGGQVIIGFVNVIATIYAILKIDKYGRKKLMLGGVTGMAISLVIVGLLFLLKMTSGVIILIFILTFCASFAIGVGPVVWVLLSEIYPTNIRGRAMSIATLALWIGGSNDRSVCALDAGECNTGRYLLHICTFLYSGTLCIENDTRNKGKVPGRN